MTATVQPLTPTTASPADVLVRLRDDLAAGRAPATSTVGVEPMVDGIRDGSDEHRAARSAVVVRFGEVHLVIATDVIGVTPAGRVVRRLPDTLEELVAVHAAKWGATPVPGQWQMCPWCNRPDDLCPELYTHLPMAAGALR